MSITVSAFTHVADDGEFGHFLIPEDKEFFVRHVVLGPAHQDRGGAPTSQAQERIAAASRCAAAFVAALVGEAPNPDDALIDLLDFVDSKALLIFVRVSNEANAFVTFEVLNDRGLDLSVADLLKNYVFRLAGDRVTEAHGFWQTMTTLITDTADETDVKNFIRHAWIARHGLTREKQLYEAIKRKVKTKALVVPYLKELAGTAAIYAALKSPSHDRWRRYAEPVSEALELFELVGVTQIRPLLLAVFSRFSEAEVNKALPMMLGWTVRFLICGSGGSGTLETRYAQRAKDVTEGDILTVGKLYAAMAQSCLRTERSARPSPRPRYPSLPSPNTTCAPSKPGTRRTAGNWKSAQIPTRPTSSTSCLRGSRGSGDIPEAGYANFVKRIGNCALMNARLNIKIANAGFEIKKASFAASTIALTRQVASYGDWTEAEIDGRQSMLAGLAVSAWPLRARP